MKRKVTFVLLGLVFVLFCACKEDIEVIPDDKEEEEVISGPEPVLAPDSLTSIVKEMSPSENQMSTHALSIPYATFNRAIGQELEIEDDSVIKIIKPVLDSAVVYNLTTNELVLGEFHWNEEKDSVYFLPEQVFHHGDNYSFNLVTHWEWLEDEEWVVVSDEKRYTEFGVNSLELIELVEPTSIEERPISIHSEFQVRFAHELDKSLFLDRNTREVRLSLDSYTVTSLNVPVEGVIRWLSSTVCVFTPNVSMLPNTIYEIEVKLNFAHKLGNEWVPLEDSGGVFYSTINGHFETKSTEDSNIIGEQDISYEYPLPNQLYFLKEESSIGFLKLNGINFYNENDFEYLVRFTLLNGASTDVNLEYVSQENRFSFDLPQDLENRRVYNLKYIQKSKAGSEEEIFHELNFRTSQYNTYREKYNEIYIGGEWTAGVSEFGLSGVFNIGEYFSFPEEEALDIAEWKTLVKYEAILENNSWYNRTVMNGFSIRSLYDIHFENNGYKIDRSDYEEIGVPPVNAFVTLFSEGSSSMELTDAIIQGGGESFYLRFVNCTILYRLPYYVYLDYVDIWNQIQDAGRNDIDMPAPEDFFSFGIGGVNYDFYHRYVLPDGTITFDEIWNIYQ
ncbi:MAG: hypothetical protein OCD76_10575 [Reichenbachiella sp.]